MITVGTFPGQIDAATLDDEERETIWQHGYTTGRDAALNLRTPTTAWMPLPTTWRDVAAGDTFLGDGTDLWHVQTVERHPEARVLHVRAVRAGHLFEEVVPADEPITILTPTPERDAVLLLRDQLSATTPERRTA